MYTSVTSFLLLLAMAIASCTSCLRDPNPVQLALNGVLQATNVVRTSMDLVHGLTSSESDSAGHDVVLMDCERLYDESVPRLTELISGEGNYTREDARTWLSGVLANHRSCWDGLEEKGFLKNTSGAHHYRAVTQNLTMVLDEALALYGKSTMTTDEAMSKYPNGGLLASWSPATSRADFVVAKDGSGTHTTLNQAVAALARMGHRRPPRAIIYVKSGVYNEKVEIGGHMKNVMLVGDGMDRTVITGSRSVVDGDSTLTSATFGVSGDGFWARDITFENTAGPQKHQAVALRVSSDLAVFYRCSIKGYQDTLYTHSLRQFYRDCHIYGTIDFIFGDAPVVLQNCDILVRRPMGHQSNMITAQGRDNPGENTGIVIQGCRVRPAREFEGVKGSYRTYLGRPWQRYSRTLFLKTDLDGLVDPKGWTEWRGSFALSTLYYGEYMDVGVGASTDKRVRWPGFHVLNSPQEVSPFTVSRFIQGESWILGTGVPVWLGI
ncbi:probable pectinesterase/pectinesterase inhibitor 36 [Rosa rugosa]|uniref:probable pectinesterase/pectinesterase inhibitor 36 n=1 Tax=Rosa rugosa TaxID=74645 RepID=UPI002B403602|nr:probable pectinesterase/pectinesterase inhibitor 36 [Rosa rugosa]